MLWYRHIEEPQDMGWLHEGKMLFAGGEHAVFDRVRQVHRQLHKGKGNVGKTIQQVCDGKKAKVNFGGDEQLSLF